MKEIKENKVEFDVISVHVYLTSSDTHVFMVLVLVNPNNPDADKRAEEHRPHI